MSPRITRASARQAASQAESPAAAAAAAAGLTTAVAASASTPNHPTRASTRKRKANDTSPPQASPPQPTPSRRSKRQKVPDPIPEPVAPESLPPRNRKGKAAATMSSPGFPPESALTPSNTSAASSRKPSRSKKNTSDVSATAASTSTRKSRRSSNHAPDPDTKMAGTDDADNDSLPPPPPTIDEDGQGDAGDNGERDEDDDDEEEEDEEGNPYGEEEDDDDEMSAAMNPFGSALGGAPRGMSSSLAMLSSLMSLSGMGQRFRDILSNLRQKEDPSLQLIALQELSEILLVSNEDNLAGTFAPEQFAKELVALMQPNEITGEENPEMMLLACRCLANLMEALPSSASHVVFAGAVPVLCQKLLEISFIDLAEQALSTLEKISYEYPTSIIREGGLTACLSYLDFFATSTQRTAVTTAANCCRMIPEDTFPVVRDVMPILLNVLNSSDQRVVEQASKCVSRIVENFKGAPSKLEELIDVDLLKAILRLLLPGTTNLISPDNHTKFLRVLAITAKASPRLSAELFKMNVVETLYQILTGVSPPSGTEDVAAKLDSVLIMQALIHRPREQIIETLNVICELLPALPGSADPASGQFVKLDTADPSASRKKSTNDKRVELLAGCKTEVRRFALILFPTLTDAFSSTVNLSVRQKVLMAQLKMLSNLDIEILVEALKAVPYASFLASILSQQDHDSLVMYALQATELLMSRLDEVYRYQLYREGVIAEITKLAAEQPAIEEIDLPILTPRPPPPVAPASHDSEDDHSDHEDEDGEENDDQAAEAEDEDGEDEGSDHSSADEDNEHEHDSDDEHDNEEGHGSQEEDNENEDDDDDEEMSGSPSSDSLMSLDAPPTRSIVRPPSLRHRIVEVSKQFLETHETEKHGKAMKKKASKVLDRLSEIASQIEAFYLHRSSANLAPEEGQELFKALASFFDSDVLESVTSAELLASSVVRVLEGVFSNPDESLATAAQSAFLQVFMGYSVRSKPKTATADSPATPFSVLIHKLQDLLSRSEHFEVLTVHHNALDGNRSSAASMLAKQIRLKLVADDDSDIPRAYRSIMVTIHAIATFKSLDDYLRPRISLSERPRSVRRENLSRALAALAGSAGLPFGVPSASRLGERAPPQIPGSSPFSSSGPGLGSSTRSARKSTPRPSHAPETPAPASASASTPKEKTSVRRSTRRHPGSTATPPPPRPPPEEDDDLENALECADEKQLSDDDEDLHESGALDTVVGQLDEDMDDEPTSDPSAVNMEVAAGGKITARKEDGTRIPTPSHGSSATPSRASASAAAAQSTPTPSASSRPSYAAALQAVPQDWHIEFSTDDKVIPNETTIYRAVHSSSPSEEQTGRSVWSAVHSIKFRRVPGPPPAETISFSTSTGNTEASEGTTPETLAKNPTSASILRLLKILHDLNANIDDVLVENKDAVKLNIEPLSQFVNTKLTAKLNRQLEEPLIVASNCLPGWSEDLARLYPFLFPFETRHLFLQSTSFGYARSMSRWQNAQSHEESRRDRRDERPFLGRLQRQKVRISRSKILESAVKVMELYGASQSILEVEYFEEVGTGLGPTLEFYSTVSKEFSKRKLKLWRDTDTDAEKEFVVSPNGLFPRPLSDEDANGPNGTRILGLFKVLGKFVARSMLDSRIIDINLNPIFFRIGDESSGVRPSLGAINVVDPALARSLMLIKKFAMAKKDIDEDPHRTPAQKVADVQNITVNNVAIEQLSLDFTLPGHADIELIPNGTQVNVTIENVDLYLEKVLDMTLGKGVRRQVDAFRTGFSQVFPYSALSAFTPDELVTLFGRAEEDWSLETLMDSIKADHGYNMDSNTVHNLLETMSKFTPQERRDFLQFTTGSPKLPIGGFRSLTPMFTVVCKPSEHPYTPDDYLPSVMTCVNYLKLPNYTDISIMKKQLSTAMREGQGAFHLS